MAPVQPTVRAEREKKLKSLISFASGLAHRFSDDRDATLANDIQTHIRGFPLQASPALAAKQDELDKLGTELWNLSTRLRRDDADTNGSGKAKTIDRRHALCFLRVFAFLLLDSAAATAKARHQKTCVRLMKVALKAARVCVDSKELNYAMKVLESAADYENVLSKAASDVRGEEQGLETRLRLEYFAVRTLLAWKQDSMDTAEHMFTKCKQLHHASSPTSAENIADLLYEIGKSALAKQEYQVAATWLERGYDTLGQAEMNALSPEANELRLSIMHNMVQAYMKLKSHDAQDRAWQMVNLMETDYADKMVVMLLKIELLSTATNIDSGEFYTVLLRMIRTVVLNDTNFRTIMHHLHKLKELSNASACKALDELIERRLLREENQTWIEKAIITRIWIGTTSNIAESVLEDLQELFSVILQNTKASLSAPATHAAQTLLWKRVESTSGNDQVVLAEAWCRLCLHPLFEKAGTQNRSKIARKLIQCALSRQDFAAANYAYSKMSDIGKNDPITQYLMFKVGLQSGDMDLASECLDSVARSSSKDATLLYACVMDAQGVGDKRQAIQALERVLDRYNYGAPAGIHLPALLRSTARLLQSELVENGKIETSVMEQLCKVFEGACTQAKASKRRPSNDSQRLFTKQELEWFSKNTYNLALQHCANMNPEQLMRLLNVSIEMMRLLKEQQGSDTAGDLCLRMVFCEFLTACTYTTMARAEDKLEDYLQYYLEVRKHSRAFRSAVAEGIENLGGSAQADIISKHLQVVKLELEAALKLEKWDDLDDLFDQCWKYKSPDHYETLADLVLVIHSCIAQADTDERYKKKVLCVLEKIINLNSRQTGKDVTKLSRWLRCLFNLSLTHDESVSLRCIKQAVDLAQRRHGKACHIPPTHLLQTPPQSSDMAEFIDYAHSADEDFKGSDQYPQTELEWLATTTFNHGIDHYVQGNDEKCKEWANQAFVLAQWMDDEGMLRGMLMEKFATLAMEA